MFADEDDLAEVCAREPVRSTLAALGIADAAQLPRGAIVARVHLAAVVGTDVLAVAKRSIPKRTLSQPKPFGVYRHSTPNVLPAQTRRVLCGYHLDDARLSRVTLTLLRQNSMGSAGS